MFIKKFFLVTAILFAALQADAWVTGDINGVVDGVSGGNTSKVVSGWACGMGVNASIDVHMYLNGQAGSGQGIGGWTANSGNEPAINSACATTTASHRYSIPMNYDFMEAHQNKTIYIHGISPTGQPNYLLSNSGVYTVPTVPSRGKVIGNIDGITNNTITGWACGIGVNSSISVHMYLNGPAGSGQGIGSYTANQWSEPSISYQCYTTASAYRFYITLNDAFLQQHQGKTLYLHGISPTTQANDLLTGSGGFIIPVNAPANLTYTNPVTYSVGTAISNNNPSNSGGGITTYSVSPALPSGLSLNTSTGVISGTPTVAASSANYTISGSNSAGTANFNLNITVNSAVQPPSSLSYATNPASYTAGTAISNNSPSNSGGSISSYSVSPSLPAGLNFNTSTGVISGTPTSVSSQTNYTVTGTNSAGSTNVTLTITVNSSGGSGSWQSVEFLSSGTYQIPANATQVQVYAVGGGGGGGSDDSAGVGYGGGGGGGAGGSYSTSAPTSGTLTIAVGQGGSGGTGVGADNATDGQDTVVSASGWSLTAGGGKKGKTRYGSPQDGGGAGGTGNLFNGGAGGQGYNVVAAGSVAGSGSCGQLGTCGGGSGGAAGPNYGPGNSGGGGGGGSRGNGGAGGIAAGSSAASNSGGGGGAAGYNGAYYASGNGGSGYVKIYVLTSGGSGGSAPTNLTYSNANATYTVGTAISNNSPSNGGGAITSYSISPALSAGLSLSTSTGVISGTPTAAASVTTYTVTGSNSYGSTTANVTITVSSGGGGSGSWTITTFTQSGTYTIPANATQVQVYAVGGGGGAGSDDSAGYGYGGGGGGGAGGSYSASAPTSGTLTVTVGQGGSGGTGVGVDNATDGQDTVVSTSGWSLTAGGGKKGKTRFGSPQDGGGAGGTGNLFNGGAGGQGYTLIQGGSAAASVACGQFENCGGGSGGAPGPYYGLGRSGGGGGGGSHGAGGTGGIQNGSAASANTGGGGGAAGYDNAYYVSGGGGSGIVKVAVYVVQQQASPPQPPQINLTASPKVQTYIPSYTFTLNSNVSVSNVEFKIDGQTVSNGTTNLNFTGNTSVGNHVATFKVTGANGVVSNTLSYSWIVFDKRSVASFTQSALNNLADSSLKTSRYEASKTFSRMCYFIEGSLSIVSSNCKALLWYEFPWGTDIRTGLESRLQRFDGIGNYKAEASVPEYIDLNMMPIEYTQTEIDIMNMLTQKYRSGLAGLVSASTNFNDYIVPNTLNYWPSPGTNGIPSLETPQGWYYHLWFGINYINAGASISGITQANIRFFNYVDGVPANIAARGQILAAYIKALKAYKKLISGQNLLVKAESVQSWWFDYSNGLPEYIDLQKWVVDTDIADGNGNVPTKDGTGTLPCYGTASAGQMCIVNKPTGAFTREGENTYYNYLSLDLYGVPVSLELDGCQGCALMNPNGSVLNGVNYPIYKRPTDSWVNVTNCSAYIRNGLSPTMQYISQLPSVRHAFNQYMQNTITALTNQRKVNFYYPQPVQVDQNNLTGLYDENLNAPAGGVIPLVDLQFIRSKVKYCPNASGEETNINIIEGRLYKADECGDLTNITSVLSTENRLSQVYHSRTEYYAVTKYYYGFFERTPDEEGMLYWVGRFRNAQCSANPGAAISAEASTIADLFYGSAEYAGRNRNDTGYVTDLYRAFLQREPDTTGLNYWVATLDPSHPNHRTRDQLRAEFIASPEFQGVLSEMVSAGCTYIW